MSTDIIAARRHWRRLRRQKDWARASYLKRWIAAQCAVMRESA